MSYYATSICWLNHFSFQYLIAVFRKISIELHVRCIKTLMFVIKRRRLHLCRRIILTKPQCLSFSIVLVIILSILNWIMKKIRVEHSGTGSKITPWWKCHFAWTALKMTRVFVFFIKKYLNKSFIFVYLSNWLMKYKCSFRLVSFLNGLNLSLFSLAH